MHMGRPIIFLLEKNIIIIIIIINSIVNYHKDLSWIRLVKIIRDPSYELNIFEDNTM